MTPLHIQIFLKGKSKKSRQFGDSRYSYINFRNFVPGPVIYGSGLRQSKYRLKNSDGFSGSGTVDTISVYCRNCRVGFCDCIQLFLDLPHLFAPGAVFQEITRPGRRNTGNFRCGINVHVFAVKIAQNFNS